MVLWSTPSGGGQPCPRTLPEHIPNREHPTTCNTHKKNYTMSSNNLSTARPSIWTTSAVRSWLFLMYTFRTDPQTRPQRLLRPSWAPLPTSSTEPLPGDWPNPEDPHVRLPDQEKLVATSRLDRAGVAGSCEPARLSRPNSNNAASTFDMHPFWNSCAAFASVNMGRTSCST